MKNILLIVMASSFVSMSLSVVHAHEDKEQDTHATEQHTAHPAHPDNKSHEGGADDHGQTGTVELSDTQRTLANIRVETILPKQVDYQLYAPAEILANGYTSYLVSPRVSSVVLRRHVALGDHVQRGQKVVTLFSDAVAKAQAQFRQAHSEWQRVRTLGRKAVGEKRYIAAQTNYQASMATLLAYGLSEQDIQQTHAQSDIKLGTYSLYAETDGVVLSDNFKQGQRIEPGAPLISIANEKTLWAEARLPADLAITLPKGMKADVAVGPYQTVGVVAQEAHTIDQVTRTRTVRLLINNQGHRLHPGQFAEVFFRFRTKEPVMAVPEAALIRDADGEWIVFVTGDHDGEFRAQSVEVGRALGTMREIKGLKAGTTVVTNGAFFVASEMAKSTFETHNH